MVLESWTAPLNNNLHIPVHSMKFHHTCCSSLIVGRYKGEEEEEKIEEGMDGWMDGEEEREKEGGRREHRQ